MCEPTTIALLASAATSAGGAYLQKESADDAANKQQSIINAAAEENQAVAKEGEKLTNDFAKDVFDPAAREQRYDQQVGKREESLGAALASANAESPTAGASGNVSADYTAASGASKAAGSAEAAKQAKLMARVGGSGLLYGSEALMGGNLASELGGVGQKLRRNGQYAQTAAGAVRDTGSLAGSLMQGAGAAYGAYGGRMGGASGGAGYPDSLPTRGGR